MTDLEILARTLLALGFGAILGLETETRISEETKGSKKQTKKQLEQRIGGVRTYTVLSLFGAVSGILFQVGQPLFAYIMFAAVFFIVLAAYVMNVQYHRRFGMTTEIAILITVLVGFASTAGIMSLQILVILIVILTFILSQKRGIAKLTENIAHQELQDVVKFAIVAIVVVPFLPDQNLMIGDISGLTDLISSLGVSNDLINSLVIFNPIRLWQYVVLISGFNLLGYFANRVFGKAKGLLMTGVFGGFVSSTSTMVALAERSKNEKAEYMWRNLGGVGLIANAVSFAQMMVLAASASVVFFSAVVSSSVAMVIGSVVVAIWFMSRTKKDVEQDVEVQYQPYSIGPAVKFALLLTVLRVIIQIVNFYMGESAFVFVTALSGMLGMDIATITLGEVVAQGGVTIQIAVIAFIIANGVNFAAKSFYSFLQGSLEYFKVIATGLFISLLAGLIGALITLAGI